MTTESDTIDADDAREAARIGSAAPAPSLDTREADPPAPDGKPKGSARDRLMRRLDNLGALEGETENEEEPPAAEDEPPAAEDEPPAAEDEPPAAPEKPEPAETPDDIIAAALAKAEAPAPESDEFRLSNKDFRALSKEGKAQFEKIRTAKKQAEEVLTKEKPWSEYGKQMAKVLDETGISDDEYTNWMGVGRVVAKGGQEAIDTLLTLATNLGYRPQAPTTPGRPSWLKKMVKDHMIDEEQADAIEAQLAVGATPPPPAAPVKPLASAAPSVAARPDPNAGMRERILAADTKLREFDASNRAKFGEKAWAILREEVRAEMASYGRTEPEQFGTVAGKSLELVLARHRAKAKKTAPRTLPGGTASQSASARLDSLKGRARVTELARRKLL
jgi:hypothetical protein